MQYFDDTIRIISDALRTVNTDKMELLISQCNKALENGHKIIVSGLGKNVPICEKFVGTMVSLGMEACFLHTNSAVHGDMGIVKDNDLVILLTKSGKTAESVYLAQHLKKRNITLWLLTFTKDSELSQIVNDSLVISMEHEGDMWNIVPNNSTTLNLIVLQTVAMNLAKMRNIPMHEFHRNHPGGHIGVLLNEEDKL